MHESLVGFMRTPLYSGVFSLSIGRLSLMHHVVVHQAANPRSGDVEEETLMKATDYSSGFALFASCAARAEDRME